MRCDAQDDDAKPFLCEVADSFCSFTGIRCACDVFVAVPKFSLIKAMQREARADDLSCIEYSGSRNKGGGLPRKKKRREDESRGIGV
jgi:hypothetical protein